MNEIELQNRIRLAISVPSTRMFRNNVGCIEGKDGRRVTFGLCKGSSDLIGFKAVTITPDMVGQSIAVFTAIEVKTPTGRISPEQKRFTEMVNSFGGIGAIVRSVDEAVSVFEGYQIR